MTSRHNSEAIAEAFWESAGGRALFGSPVNVERAATRALPVGVHRVSGLNTRTVSNLLTRVAADPWFGGTPRPLRGCLIADAGKALLLVDGDDPEDETRMTVAHEVAHLLLHYLKPRNEAVKAFGLGILAVLDRTRPATPGEFMSSILRNVSIEPYRHAMDRRPLHARAVNAMEEEADDLAVEFIAPWRELKHLHGVSPGLLRERFGLTALVAARLASLIRPSEIATGVLSLFRPK